MDSMEWLINRVRTLEGLLIEAHLRLDATDSSDELFKRIRETLQPDWKQR